MIASTRVGKNDVMVAALRARSSITADLLFINSICTWIYWTAMQQKIKQQKSYRKGEYPSSCSSMMFSLCLQLVPNKVPKVLLSYYVRLIITHLLTSLFLLPIFIREGGF